MTRDEAALVLVTRVLAREGGVKDIGDGAGVTTYGQTSRWLVQFGLPIPKTVVEAAQNYLTWLTRTGLIGVCDAPDSFADAVIDFAVNSGHRPAIQELQRMLGTKPDSIYGPETQAKVDACDRQKMARFMLGTRLRYDGRLITKDPVQYARWAEGWMNRIASQVEAL